MTEKQAIDKLVSWATGQIGNKEGANNYNKYAPIVTKLIGWNAQNQPWCDIFTDAGFIECFGLDNASKMTYQPIGRGSAACKTSAQFFKKNNAWFNSPKVGDIIFFYYSGDINHQGIVVEVSGGVVTTVEGNSSDMVKSNSYAVSNPIVAGFGRPNWDIVTDVADTPTADDEEQFLLPTLKKGDTGEIVRTAQLLLNGRKCSCGIWGADGEFGNATEAAVLAFQRRNGLGASGIVTDKTWIKLLGL